MVASVNYQLKEESMLVYKEDRAKGIVEIVVDGKLTQDEYTRCLQPLEAMIALHGKIKILEEIRGFSGVEPSALWEGIKFDFHHLKDISHCAVVSDKGWVGPIAKASGAFLACKVRVFPLAELEQARQWLNAPDSPNNP